MKPATLDKLKLNYTIKLDYFFLFPCLNMWKKRETYMLACTVFLNSFSVMP